MCLFTVLLAESALERVPRELWGEKQIVEEARRQKCAPGELLLDSSQHVQLMKKRLKDWRKRGRPDIVHFCALLALDSRLNLEGNLSFLVHTRDDEVISFDPGVRLPQVYGRFCGLVQDLFKKRKIEHAGKSLLELERKTLPHLLAELEVRGEVIVLDVGGQSLSLKGFSEKISAASKDGRDACFVVGGFPHDTFETKQLKKYPRVSISSKELCAWTVVADVLAACELALTGRRAR